MENIKWKQCIPIFVFNFKFGQEKKKKRQVWMQEEEKYDIFAIAQRFLKGGDELLKVEFVREYYTVWEALLEHYTNFCVRHGYTQQKLIPLEALATTEFECKKKVSCCRECTKILQTSNIAQHLQCPRICKHANKNHRLQRMIYLHMKVSYRASVSSGDDNWIVLEPQHPKESRPEKRQLMLEHVQDVQPPRTKQLCLTWIDYEPSDIFVRLQDVLGKFVLRDCNMVIETKDSLQIITQQIAQSDASKRVLVLGMTSQHAFFAESNIQVLEYRHAVKMAYRYDVKPYLTDEGTNKILAQFSAAQMAFTWTMFHVIIVEASNLNKMLFYLVVLRFLQANCNAKLLIWSSPTESQKEIDFLGLLPRLFISTKPWKPWCNMQSVSVSTALRQMRDNFHFANWGIREEVLQEAHFNNNFPEGNELLYGQILPLAYKHKGNESHFFTSYTLSKNRVWYDDDKGLLCAHRYRHLVAKQLPILTNEQISLLFLCVHVDTITDVARARQILIDLSNIDWLSGIRELVFADFEKIGVYDMERCVFKDGLHGRIDGRCQNGELLELKYSKHLLTMQHRVQVLLYHCMFDNGHDSCVLFNYRTGEKIRLHCATKDKEALFAKLLALRTLNDAQQILIKHYLKAAHEFNR